MGKRRYRLLSDDDRRRIVELARQGLSHVGIAEAVGASHGSVGNVLTPLGGVLRAESWRCSRFRLSLDERVEIALGVGRGESYSAIARRVNRSPSTISREVAHHGGRCAYQPVVAHRAAWQAARRPKTTKLAACSVLRGEVAAGLEAWWSPQQIARRLCEQHPGMPERQVSHETIYKSLYVQGRGELRRELTRCLRTGRAQRRAQGRVFRNSIKDMVMISERPAEVEDRAVPGHWEGDLILGRNRQSQVGMLAERSTRYTLLFRLPTDRTAVSVRDALVRTIRTLPAHLRRSLTWDNGKEMAEHRAITIATDVQVYFCDPGHPWQRGTAENTVGLLRAYLPHGEDLSRYSARDLAAIAAELNRRPRKTLGWRSPAEAYAEALAVQ